MRLHKTGHIVADTVSDLVAELPDGDYAIGYGILRGTDLFLRGFDRWFEMDKGFSDAFHYDGNYRLSYKGTQPLYSPDALHEANGLKLEPWITRKGYTLICPPTESVCEFFGIDYVSWLWGAFKQCASQPVLRPKGCEDPIDWDKVGRIITFNSTIGIEALRRGIPVISDPDHSTIGSYTKHINCVDNYDRSVILDFMQAHQFKLVDKGKIWGLIQHYLYRST